MNFKFIYFDLGGVVFTDLVIKQFAKEYNLSLHLFTKAYQEVSNQVCTGLMSGDELWEYYQKKVGFNYPLNDYNEFWFARSRPIKEVHSLIKEIIDNGYEIGLITNIFKDSWSYIYKYKLIPDLEYQAIVDSTKVKLSKPDERIYKHAQELTNYKAKQIFYIDNVKRYLDVAKNLGWNVFHFDQNNVKKSIQLIKKII